jgi:hypothetical protein
LPKSHKSSISNFGRYLGNSYKKYLLKQDISPLCNLCTTCQNDNCLHLLSCCNLRTNRHNKVVHSFINILGANPVTQWFELLNVGKFDDCTPDNTIPSWLVPCTFFLPHSQCLTKLPLDIFFCPMGTTHGQTTLCPKPNLKI